MQLWTFWIANLNLPPDLFWEVSPREYFALANQYQKIEQARNIRAGTVAAMVLNAQRTDTKQKFWTWEDFFGDPRVKIASSPKKSAKQMFAEYEAAHRAYLRSKR